MHIDNVVAAISLSFDLHLVIFVLSLEMCCLGRGIGRRSGLRGHDDLSEIKAAAGVCKMNRFLAVQLHGERNLRTRSAPATSRGKRNNLRFAVSNRYLNLRIIVIRRIHERHGRVRTVAGIVSRIRAARGAGQTDRQTVIQHIELIAGLIVVDDHRFDRTVAELNGKVVVAGFYRLIQQAADRATQRSGIRVFRRCPCAADTVDVRHGRFGADRFNVQRGEVHEVATFVIIVIVPILNQYVFLGSTFQKGLCILRRKFKTNKRRLSFFQTAGSKALVLCFSFSDLIGYVGVTCTTCIMERNVEPAVILCSVGDNIVANRHPHSGSLF